MLLPSRTFSAACRALHLAIRISFASLRAALALAGHGRRARQVPHRRRQHAQLGAALEQHWHVLLWQSQVSCRSHPCIRRQARASHSPRQAVTRLLLHTAWRSNKENTACPHTLSGPLNRLPSTSPARALARARACCSFVSRRGSRARSSDDGRHRDSRGAPLRVNLILKGTSRRWHA